MEIRWNSFKISVFIIACAILDLLLTLLGVWSVEGVTRTWVLSFEAMTLSVLLINSIMIRRSVCHYKNTRQNRFLASLMVFSLLFCLAGDVTNFNLTQSYFQHGDVVKHDYLADSVWFFVPGYTLMFIACWRLMDYSARQTRYFIIATLITATLGLLSYLNMHIPGSGWYVSLMTGFYAVFIAQAALLGLCLLINKNFPETPRYSLAAALILATVADALIGQFWIFGNGGLGYYPQIRAINWVFYITSQAIVIHLPLVALARAHGSSRTCAAGAGFAK
ncbi:hypothetical protein [Pseudoalteromonas sp. OOF1S-7]|uniref:hypothetical protein n=1 Tax=Pseudoalteromonas sp. OOF1S-7 TaxID=2917757 RepID=UPI001EF4C409|nr:hypothetical protein [Pseudoalteromonas sp. OOF1S-7]MCG7537250.1 hypothetical protein [Pseudoalteromonas sp. OOF1S-7]